MKVLELQPAKHVLWQVVDGPKEWIGTKVNWELKQEDDYAIVLFKHQDWREPVEFMHHCSRGFELREVRQLQGGRVSLIYGIG